MAAAAKRFFRLAKGVEVASIKVTKQQALDALYLLARDTPVDTAKSRSNWRIGLGRPLTSVVSAYRPYASRHRPPYAGGGSKGESSNLNAVVAVGALKLIRYQKGSIYISNNVPYIGPLDRGHSSQTSAGFVARAVLGSINMTEPKVKDIFDEEFSK